MSKKSRRHQSVPHDEDASTTDRPWDDPSDAPPDDLPIYRLITGKDDATFCHRVSEALKLGYRLHASPAVTFNGTDVIAAQAVLWPHYEYVGDIPF